MNTGFLFFAGSDDKYITAIQDLFEMFYKQNFFIDYLLINDYTFEHDTLINNDVVLDKLRQVSKPVLFQMTYSINNENLFSLKYDKYDEEYTLPGFTNIYHAFNAQITNTAPLRKQFNISDIIVDKEIPEKLLQISLLLNEDIEKAFEWYLNIITFKTAGVSLLLPHIVVAYKHLLPLWLYYDKHNLMISSKGLVTIRRNIPRIMVPNDSVHIFTLNRELSNGFHINLHTVVHVDATYVIKPYQAMLVYNNSFNLRSVLEYFYHTLGYRNVMILYIEDDLKLDHITIIDEFNYKYIHIKASQTGDQDLLKYLYFVTKYITNYPSDKVYMNLYSNEDILFLIRRLLEYLSVKINIYDVNVI